MRRAHRRAHLLMWLILLPLIGALIALAHSVRTPYPIEPREPAAYDPQ